MIELLTESGSRYIFQERDWCPLLEQPVYQIERTGTNLFGVGSDFYNAVIVGDIVVGEPMQVCHGEFRTRWLYSTPVVEVNVV